MSIFASEVSKPILVGESSMHVIEGFKKYAASSRMICTVYNLSTQNGATGGCSVDGSSLIEFTESCILKKGVNSKGMLNE